MSELKIAKDLSLPIDAIGEVIAILARRGAGKTYGAQVLAEEMLDAGAQVVILDPVSRWWSLRLAADGRGKGFEVPVFGGARADLPLYPTSGELVARVAVERGVSMVLDITGIRKRVEQRTFVTDFVDALYRLKQEESAPTPIHLFLEEADQFIPQKPRGAMGVEMVDVLTRMVKLGRNYGMGVTLITQRSASVDKDALSQVGTMVALATTSPHDKGAVRDWVVGNDEDPAPVAALAKLKKGEAFVWSPGFGIAQQIKFRRKVTFDATATPKLGARKDVAPPKLAGVELAQLSSAMATADEEVKANDPTELKKRIAELEQQLRARPAAAPAKVERVEVPVNVPVSIIGPQEIEGLISAARSISEAATALQKRVRDGGRVTLARPPSRLAPPPSPIATSSRPSPPPTNGANGVHLKAGARRMLAALATAPGAGLSRTQLATLVQMRPTTGTFRSYLSSLRGAGYIGGEPFDGVIQLTPAGRAAAGSVEVPQTTEELVALWLPKLKAGARRMLHALVEAHPGPVTREQLGEELGDCSITSGTFRSYLSSLKGNGLARVVGDEVFASETLFPGGAA